MKQLRNRVVAGILGLALVVGLASCGGDQNPSTTTLPGGTTTTEEVGS